MVSKILHLLRVVPFSDVLVDEINKKAIDFVWGASKHLIKKEAVFTS